MATKTTGKKRTTSKKTTARKPARKTARAVRKVARKTARTMRKTARTVRKTARKTAKKTGAKRATARRSLALARVSTPPVPALRCVTLSSTASRVGAAPLCRSGRGTGLRQGAQR